MKPAEGDARPNLQKTPRVARNDDVGAGRNDVVHFTIAVGRCSRLFRRTVPAIRQPRNRPTRPILVPCAGKKPVPSSRTTPSAAFGSASSMLRVSGRWGNR
ncbi:MAG: hypothetical protein BLM47_08525 [Candidatus Reconcilbacillus cellulovorans]|uniref:Uncharacterized protein n=1 Tax=Candidatus Reconcilbacillus cellulovorans TaxID=1906605 RepID=A0A2A6DZK1_9BACL|nr:MAG: hypothetical protein BLM47_08525 [Candidatus Reconcilbacillus cellulovorans]